MHSPAKLPLGRLLVDAGVLTAEQLARGLAEQKRGGDGRLLGEVLVELGLASDDQITEALAAAYGMPYARVSPKVADPKVMGALPREFLEKHRVLPLFCVEGVLTVAVHELANVFLTEEIAREAARAAPPERPVRQVQLVAATARDIHATIQTYLPNDKVFVIDDLIEDVQPDEFSLVETKVEDIGNLEQAAGDSPVIKLVNYLIFNAVKDRASDIHIEPGDGSFRVRFRVDGRLVEKLRPPPRMQAAVVSRIKIMAGMDIAERRVPQDGGIHVMMDKRPVDLRVSTMPGKHGEKVVVRVIDNDKAGVNLEKLGFGVDTLKRFRKLLDLPNGILLVTGPTGSGKSTTLYAALAEMNANDTNICTVEDPVEYSLAGVNQFQVNEKAGFTFAGALRALLRQDPDVMMIGEVRDVETAKLATQASLTGHLVFSTLHTNDACGAVTRLYNLGVEPYLVGATVSGVLAQRLVRKLCPHCRVEARPEPNEKRAIERVAGAVETVYRPKGCDRCRGLGFSGRVGVYELFVPDDACGELMSRGAPLGDLREAAVKAGMGSLRSDGIEKVKSGVTTLEEVYRVTA